MLMKVVQSFGSVDQIHSAHLRNYYYTVFCLACCFLFDVQFPLPLMKEDSHFIIKYPHHHPKR